MKKEEKHGLIVEILHEFGIDKYPKDVEIADEILAEFSGGEEKVSNEDIKEWAKHKVRNLHEVFPKGLMWEDLLIIGAQAMQDKLIERKDKD